MVADTDPCAVFDEALARFNLDKGFTLSPKGLIVGLARTLFMGDVDAGLAATVESAYAHLTAIYETGNPPPGEPGSRWNADGSVRIYS